MVNKSLMKISLTSLLIAHINNVGILTATETTASVRGVLALGGLAVTTAVTKMLCENKFIDRHTEKTGVRSKELAAVTGLMGGLFSLSNAVPQCSELGWKVPVFYLAFKIANGYLFNKYLFAHIPNVGEHVANAQILKTRDVLRNPQSLAYQIRLNSALGEARLLTANNPDVNIKELYHKLSDNAKTFLTKDAWDQFAKQYNSTSAMLQQHDSKIKAESDINADLVQTTMFATAAVTYCLYEPIKILLAKTLDYPNCMIQFSGKYIERFTSSLIS